MENGILNVNTQHGPMQILLPIEAAKLIIKIGQQKDWIAYQENQLHVMLQDVSVRRTQVELITTLRDTLKEVTFHYGDTSMTLKKDDYGKLVEQIQGIIKRIETNIESTQVRLRPAKELYERYLKEFNYLVDQARGLNRRPKK
jgi:hypothetical protein